MNWIYAGAVAVAFVALALYLEWSAGKRVHLVWYGWASRSWGLHELGRRNFRGWLDLGPFSIEWERNP